MGSPVQGMLFGDNDGDEELSIDVSAFDRATDHWLDQHSWITHVPGFLIGHDRLLTELTLIDRWEQRQRWMYNRAVDEPRLTAVYDDLLDAPATVVEIVAVLTDRLEVPYQRVWMNWYRDHADGTGWHADRPVDKLTTAIVPVLSLGAPRRFLIRPKGGGSSTVFTPAGGDLLIMRGRCQRDWQHCVPKQKSPAGPRMSLNFSGIVQAESTTS